MSMRDRRSRRAGGYVLRLYYNPLVPWIWLGAAAMALGGARLADRPAPIGSAPRPASAGVAAAQVRPPPNEQAGLALLIPPRCSRCWRRVLCRSRIDTSVLPSRLIDQPAPRFALPRSRATCKGFSRPISRACQPRQHLCLVVHAVPRRAPHPQRLARPSACRFTESITRTRGCALAWIAELGKPLHPDRRDDRTGRIDWGVYGVPETFIVVRRRIRPSTSAR